MNAAQFVRNWNDIKKEMLEAFMGDGGTTVVAGQIEAMGLSGEQRNQMRAVLDGVLRDTMYTLLLGLDGATSIGRDQQRFTIVDEGGDVVGPIEDGSLEMLPWHRSFLERPESDIQCKVSS